MDGRLGVSRFFHGENDSSAEADLFFEVHQVIPDSHFGLADFADRTFGFGKTKNVPFSSMMIA